MKITTKILIILSLAILFILLGCSKKDQKKAVEAMQEKIVIKLASSAPPTDPRAETIDSILKPAIADFADLETYWSSTLFKQGTELEAVARGNLEMVLASPQELSQFIPEFSILATGYVIRDGAHQKAIFKSDVIDDLKKMAEDKLKLKFLSIVYLGRRNLNLRGDKVINTPEDLNGVKLRMPGTKTWQFLGKALGANPTPLAFTEVYTALQSGVIDGQDNPIPTTISAKFYEVTDQVILTGHLVDFNILSISVDVWNTLTPAQQTELQAAADQVSDAVLKKIERLEKEQISFLEEQGLKVYKPDVEAFRKHVQAEYLNSEYSQVWPEGLLEKINNIK